MPVVNYVREHVRFMEYAADEHLTAGERQLWYALMHLMNRRAQGCDWPEGFIRVSNDRLLSYTTMGFDTMAKARNRLKQRGLIDYEAGKRNESSPAYKINYFYPEEFYPNNSDKEEGKEWDKQRGKEGDKLKGKQGHKEGDFILNYTEKNTEPYRNTGNRDEEEEVHAGARAGRGDDFPPDREADLFGEEAADAWADEVGGSITPALKNRIGTLANLFDFREGVVSYAVEIAATRGREPRGYVLSVLSDWADARIHTREEAERYQFLKDQRRSGGPGSPEDRALEAFLEDMKTHAG